MRHVSTILRGAALAALVLALAAVTAGASVRGDDNRDGDGAGQGTVSGDVTAPTLAAGAAPATAPASSGTAPGGPAIAPGQAGTTPGQAGVTPAQGAVPAGQAGTAPGRAGTTPGQSGAPVPVPPAVAPALGESMAVKPVAGTVKVRLPQSSGYVDLSAAGSVPSGALIDARAGTVVLRSALDAGGHTQAAQIRGAVFEVRQSKDGKGMTDLILRGGRPQGCQARGSAAVARAAAVPTARSKPRRSLWAKDDHGRFRSHGRNSAATVRGTEWTTTETCAGTLTKVVKGAVDVFDRHTKRTVRVRAGHSYLARNAR